MFMRTPDDDVLAKQQAGLMFWLLDCLPDRQALVIIDRFGLAGEEKKTLARIAGELGVSSERIRQIECVAMRKMRKKLQSRRLSASEVLG